VLEAQSAATGDELVQVEWGSYINAIGSLFDVPTHTLHDVQALLYSWLSGGSLGQYTTTIRTPVG
jgi:hypothetical protein